MQNIKWKDFCRWKCKKIHSNGSRRLFLRIYSVFFITYYSRGRRGHDRMVVGFTTTCAISTYHHWCCQFESRSGRDVQHLCDKVCQWLTTGRWFSLSTPVSSTNKSARHDITEILLKVALNTIKQTNNNIFIWRFKLSHSH